MEVCTMTTSIDNMAVIPQSNNKLHTAKEVKESVVNRTSEIISMPLYMGSLEDLEDLIKEGYYLCLGEEGDGAQDGDDMYLRLFSKEDRIGINIHLMSTCDGYGIETQKGIIILNEHTHTDLYPMIYGMPHILGERK